eukprot:1404174-Rhodomonas_salina.1
MLPFGLRVATKRQSGCVVEVADFQQNVAPVGLTAELERTVLRGKTMGRTASGFWFDLFERPLRLSVFVFGLTEEQYTCVPIRYWWDFDRVYVFQSFAIVCQMPSVFEIDWVLMGTAINSVMESFGVKSVIRVPIIVVPVLQCLFKPVFLYTWKGLGRVQPDLRSGCGFAV